MLNNITTHMKKLRVHIQKPNTGDIFESHQNINNNLLWISINTISISYIRKYNFNILTIDFFTMNLYQTLLVYPSKFANEGDQKCVKLCFIWLYLLMIIFSIAFKY